MLVIRGFGKLGKTEAINTVKVALDETPGFVRAEATGAVPKIVKAYFDSEDAKVEFLRSQADNEAFGRNSLSASRDQTYAERQRQRAINKTVRALCEEGGYGREDIILDRPEGEVCKTFGGGLTSVASVGLDAKVTWGDTVDEAVRALHKKLMLGKDS